MTSLPSLFGDFNTWSLITQSTHSTGVIGAAGFFAAAMLVVAWRGYRGGPRAAALWSLRLLILLLAGVVLWQPALLLRKTAVLPRKLVVLTDTSASMALPAGKQGSRFDIARAVATKISEDGTAKARSVDIIVRDLAGDPWASTETTQPAETTSRLLHRAGESVAGDNPPSVAGVLMITDGADTDVDASLDTPRTRAALRRLAAAGIPVSAVDVARSTAFRDESVVALVAGDFAFVQNSFTLKADIQSTGFDAAPLTVTLKRNGQIVTQMDVLPNETGRGTATFEIKADLLGEVIYTAEVTPRTGDAVPENNVAHHVVRVLRDKIRVLQVVGRPSWDERFLRQHFQEDPNVDLVSFFILRTPGDDAGPQEELSLIPFPVNELFTTKLSSFDIVLMQNFDYRPYRMTPYLKNIQRAVEGGLGFVMIGGDDAFGDGGYAETPIASILPVSLQNAGAYGGGPVTPARGPNANDHPIQLPRKPGLLPTWPGMNDLGQPKPGTSVLLQTAEGRPLVVAGETGKGRTLAVGSDGLWRWRFMYPATEAQETYRRFWNSALRWLVKDPVHASVQLKLEGDPQGTDHVAQVVVRDAAYRPKAGARVDVRVVGRDGAEVHTTSGQADANGRVEVALPPLPPGIYHVEGREEGTTQAATRGLGISSATAETRSAAPRRDLLDAITKHSGGALLDPDDATLEAIPLAEAQVVDVENQRTIPLWDHAVVLLILIGLLVAEWALRRRLGYT